MNMNPCMECSYAPGNETPESGYCDSAQSWCPVWQKWVEEIRKFKEQCRKETLELQVKLFGGRNVEQTNG